MDAARGLHLDVRPDVRAEERDVIERRPLRAESRRGLDIVGAALRHGAARRDLLLLREEASLDDDLKHALAAERLERAHLLRHILLLAGLEHADVHHHVDLRRTVRERLRRLRELRSRRRVAVREADDRRHLQPRPVDAREPRDVARRHHHRRRTVADGLLRYALHLRPGRRLLEQRMIHMG